MDMEGCSGEQQQYIGLLAFLVANAESWRSCFAVSVKVIKKQGANLDR